MSLNTHEDIEYFKEMGKVFFRLVQEASTQGNEAQQEAYVRRKMREIYTEYELSEFYDNLGSLADQSAQLHS